MERAEFRRAVFERDQHRCVICKQPANDAHHIIERRLWPDGGYHLDNGASLCGEHHILAEQTVLSCEDIRAAIGIERVLLPPHLYDDQKYDKWGNIILPNKQRVKGELFFDESVQKILKQGGVLGSFLKYVKYPRTYHLPWSPGVGKDDRVLESTDIFHGKHVIVTVKMDGENTSMYNDYIHARSIDSGGHPSRSWVKRIHAEKGFEIPDGWRVCGENLYAKHTIHYQGLPSYFQVFSVWNEKNMCLSWKNTLEWASLLGMNVVPVLYEGIWDEEAIQALYSPVFEGNHCEGYVVRLSDSFSYGDFRRSCAKFVRKGHVGFHGHWMRHQVVPNGLQGAPKDSLS